jgi:ABC-type glycerol-3-phosphate transport system substrate-binding protein
MQGFSGWLESNRAIPGARRLNTRDCVNLFQQGKVSAVVTGIRMAQAMFATADEEMRENIGFAPISPTPWVGGDSLVIWKHAQREAEREKLALALVKFLANKKNMIQFCQSAYSLPARQDTLEALYPLGHPMRDTVLAISKNGRSYPAISEWRSIEHQLVQELDAIIHTAYKAPGRSSQEILEQHLPPLAQRLNRSI